MIESNFSKLRKVAYCFVAFILMLTVVMCYNITSMLKINAEVTNSSDYNNDLANYSQAATIYMNRAMSSDANPGGSGALILTSGDKGSYPGFVGFQDKAIDGNNSYSVGVNDANNAISYSYKRLGTVATTGTVYALESRHFDFSGDTVAKLWKDVNPSTNSAMGTSLVYDYGRAGFGWTITGVADTGDDSMSLSTRFILGSLAMVVYVLAASLQSFFMFALNVVKMVNPFKIFESPVISTIGGSTVEAGVSSGIAQFVSVVGGTIQKYYSAIKGISLWVIIPATLALGVFLWLLSPRPDTLNTFWSKMRSTFVRMLFTVAFIPLAFATYDEVITLVQSGISGGGIDGSKAVLSTFCDYERWAINTGFKGFFDADLTGKIAVKTGDGSTYLSANQDLVTGARKYVYKINSLDGVHKDITGSLGAAPDQVGTAAIGSVATDTMTSHTTTGKVATHGEIIDLLQRFTRGDKIGSGKFASRYATNIPYKTHVFSENWVAFDVGSYPPIFKEGGKGIGYSPSEIADYNKNRLNDESSIIWKSRGGTGGIELSVMAAYNYMNSTFTSSGITVYSPRSSASDYVNHQHFSVSLAGTGFVKYLFFFDSLILIICLTILGYLYGIGIMFANFSAIFKLVGSVFSGLFGSMRGIATSVAIFFSLAINVVMSIAMFVIAYDVIGKFYSGLGQAVMTIVGAVTGDVGYISFIATIAAQTAFLIFVTRKFIDWRKAIITSMTEAATATINKFLGTNAVAPNLQGEGGMLQAAATLGAGAAMAAASGKYNDEFQAAKDGNGFIADDSADGKSYGESIGADESKGEYGSNLADNEQIGQDGSEMNDPTNMNDEKSADAYLAENEDTINALSDEETGSDADGSGINVAGTDSAENMNQTTENTDQTAENSGEETDEQAETGELGENGEDSENGEGDGTETGENSEANANEAGKKNKLEGDAATATGDYNKSPGASSGAQRVRHNGRDGLLLADGRFIPGQFDPNTGAFTPGVTDRNGRFHAGMLDENGLHTGTMTEEGFALDGNVDTGFDAEGNDIADYRAPIEPEGSQDGSMGIQSGSTGTQGSSVGTQGNSMGTQTGSAGAQGGSGSGVNGSMEGGTGSSAIPETFNVPEGATPATFDDGSGEVESGIRVGNSFYAGTLNDNGSFTPADPERYASDMYDSGGGIDQAAMQADAFDADAQGETMAMPEDAQEGFTTDGTDFYTPEQAEQSGIASDQFQPAIKTNDGTVMAGTVSADGKSFTRSRSGNSIGAAAYGFDANTHATPAGAEMHAVGAGGNTVKDSNGNAVAADAMSVQQSGQVSYADASGQEHVGVANADGTFNEGGSYGVLTDDGFKSMAEATPEEIADGSTGVMTAGGRFTAGSINSDGEFVVSPDQSTATGSAPYSGSNESFNHDSNIMSASDVSSAGYEQGYSSSGKAMMTAADNSTQAGVIMSDGSAVLGANLEAPDGNGGFVDYGSATDEQKANGAVMTMPNGERVSGHMDSATGGFVADRSDASYLSGGNTVSVTDDSSFGYDSGSGFISAPDGASMDVTGGQSSIMIGGQSYDGIRNADGTATIGGQAMVYTQSGEFKPIADATQSEIENGTTGVMSGGKFTAGEFDASTSEFMPTATQESIDMATGAVASGSSGSQMMSADAVSAGGYSQSYSSTGRSMMVSDSGQQTAGVMLSDGTAVQGANLQVATPSGEYVNYGSATDSQRASGDVVMTMSNGAQVQGYVDGGGNFVVDEPADLASAVATNASGQAIMSADAVSDGGYSQSYSPETGRSMMVSDSGQQTAGVMLSDGTAVQGANLQVATPSGEYVNYGSATDSQRASGDVVMTMANGTHVPGQIDSAGNFAVEGSMDLASAAGASTSGQVLMSSANVSAGGYSQSYSSTGRSMMVSGGGQQMAGVMLADGTAVQGANLQVATASGEYINYGSATDAQIAGGDVVMTMANGTQVSGHMDSAGGGFVVDEPMTFAGADANSTGPAFMSADAVSAGGYSQSYSSATGRSMMVSGSGQQMSGVMLANGTAAPGANLQVMTPSGEYINYGSATDAQRASGDVVMTMQNGVQVPGYVDAASGGFVADESVNFANTAGTASQVLMSSADVSANGFSQTYSTAGRSVMVSSSGHRQTGVMLADGGAVSGANLQVATPSGEYINYGSATDAQRESGSVVMTLQNGTHLSGHMDSAGGGFVIDAPTSGVIAPMNNGASTVTAAAYATTGTISAPAERVVSGGVSGNYDTVTTSSGATVSGVYNSNGTITEGAEKVVMVPGQGIMTRSEATSANVNMSGLQTGVRLAGGAVIMGTFSDMAGGVESFSPNVNVQHLPTGGTQAASVVTVMSGGASGGSGGGNYTVNAGGYSGNGQQGGTYTVNSNGYSGGSSGGNRTINARGYSDGGSQGGTYTVNSNGYSGGSGGGNYTVNAGGYSGGGYSYNANNIPAYTSGGSSIVTNVPVSTPTTSVVSGSVIRPAKNNANYDLMRSPNGSTSKGVYIANDTFAYGAEKGFVNPQNNGYVTVAEAKTQRMDTSVMIPAIRTGAVNGAPGTVTVGSYSTMPNGQTAFNPGVYNVAVPAGTSYTAGNGKQANINVKPSGVNSKHQTDDLQNMLYVSAMTSLVRGDVKGAAAKVVIGEAANKVRKNRNPKKNSQSATNPWQFEDTTKHDNIGNN